MELNPELVMQIQAEQVGNLMKENAMLRAAIIQFEQELYPQGELDMAVAELAEDPEIDTDDLPMPEEAE